MFSSRPVRRRCRPRAARALDVDQLAAPARLPPAGSSACSRPCSPSTASPRPCRPARARARRASPSRWWRERTSQWPAERARAALLLLGGHAVAELGGDGPGPRRVRKHMGAGDPGGVDRVQRPLERRVLLGREAHDHVGRDVDVRRQPPGPPRSAPRTRPPCSAAPSRASTPSSPDCIGTCRCGQTFGSVASASSSESLTWITSTLESRTRSTRRTRGDGDHQLAQLEAVLGVAVVADADPGHHHLRLARTRLAGATSLSTADAGRERARPRTVGMMQ